MKTDAEMMNALDDAAAKLARGYAALGQYACVMRTLPDGAVRLIAPQVDPLKVSRLLQAAADLVFDGPAAGRVKH